ncbi:MAG: ABC transporter ATP-binding protein [Actinomycetota bacterium]|nr:ABC transporter ATP-binding protein [Actinomycetota bacterium]
MMGPMFGGGGRGSASNPGGGLPFAGVPWEMQEGVNRLLADEPEHDDTEHAFSYRPAPDEKQRVTLRLLVLRHWNLALWSGLFVAVVAVANQAGPELVSYGINHGMVHKDMTVVLTVAILYVAAVGITAISQRAMVKVTGRLAAQVMHDLRVRVFTHLQRLGLDFYTDEKAGVIMTRMTSDIENLQQLLQDGLAQFAVQGLTMVVIMAVLFTTNALLALYAVLMVLPLLVVGSLWFQSASERGYDRVRDGIANVLADLSESLHGVRVVAAHNRQARNVVHHRNVVGEYRDANNYTAQINAVYGPGTQVLSYLSQAGLLAVGGEMVLHHRLSIGGLTAFFLYMNRFMMPIQLLVQQYNVFQQGQASLVKLRTLLDTAPNVGEKAAAVELPPLEGHIRFDDVSFGYDPAQPVIEHVDLEVPAGQTVAFVGPTGAGKSTLAKLVTRFYDPTAGQVLIDGHDLRDVTIPSLRRQLGVVPQEPFLFAGTIRDNIAFARPGASDDEVWEALRAVGLDDVVTRMPSGMDTEVHERGQSLSSGERQLIALARAFMARPRVLVLDEATSNLDLASETRIEAALDLLLQGRTAILIAHRLSTAMRADRIFVIDDGRVAESGTHDELVEMGGRYAAMYRTWSSHTSVTG